MAQEGFKVPHFASGSTGVSASTQVLDAADDGGANIFIAPKTGNITKIHAYFTAASGTPTIRASLQGVSAGGPDGTIKESSAAYADQVVSGAGWVTFTLGTPHSCTVGDYLAAVVRYESGSTSATLQYAVSAQASPGQPFPTAQSGGGSWVAVTSLETIVVEYDTGEIVGAPFTQSNMASGYNSSGVDYRGSRWVPNVACVVDGVYAVGRWSSTSDFTAHIFAGTSGTPVASQAVDVSEILASQATSPGRQVFIALAETTLSAGQVYRFVLQATTANNPTTIAKYTFPSSALRAAFLGSEWQYTECTTPGTWTDEADAFFYVVPRIKSVETGGGGGGGGGRILSHIFGL